MTKKYTRVLGGIALLAISNFSNAENVRLNGFASIGGGLQLEDGVEYLGYDEDLSFKSDTLLGIQLSTNLGERAELVGQLVARGNDNYNVEAEWLYVKYQFDNNVYTKAGRLRIPFFEYSDSLEVGYAYHWIRPPVEIYNIPVTSLDGVSIGYTTQFGDVSAKFDLTAGRTDQSVTVTADPLANRAPTIVDADGVNFLVPTARFEYDSMVLRVSLASFDLSVTNEQIEANLTQLSVPAPEAAQALRMDKKSVLFKGISFTATPGNMLFNAEYNDLDYDTGSLADREAYFVSAGYYVDSLLFHYTYAMVEAEPHYEILDLIGPPPIVSGVRANVLDNGLWDQNSHTFGVRWDYSAQAAIKFEYSSVESDLPGNRKAQLINIVADFVF